MITSTTDWRDHYAIRCYGTGGYHVYYYESIGVPKVKLTNRGYPTKQMAERVCEMRFKLKLDEPESLSRTYLRSHFTDVFRGLEQ